MISWRAVPTAFSAVAAMLYSYSSRCTPLARTLALRKESSSEWGNVGKGGFEPLPSPSPANVLDLGRVSMCWKQCYPRFVFQCLLYCIYCFLHSFVRPRHILGAQLLLFDLRYVLLNSLELAFVWRGRCISSISLIVLYIQYIVHKKQ